MTDILGDLKDVFFSNPVSARQAVRVLVETMSIEALRAEVTRTLERRFNNDLRSVAQLELDEGQMQLFTFGQSLPRVVRIVDELGKEDFVRWDLATRMQHDENFTWRRNYHLKRAAQEERSQLRFNRTADEIGWDPDELAGIRLLGAVSCAICGGPYDPDDPMELAHDAPVAGRNGQQVAWAHMRCNRHEGTN